MAFAAVGTAGLIGAGVAGLAGLGKIWSGFSQKHQANKALKKLKDPGYTIPQGYEKNLAEAEQLAKTGMPSEQYNQAQTNIQRGVTGGARMLGRSGKAATGIAGVVRAGIEGGLGLDVASANQRRQNILGAMGARTALSQQQLAKQQYGQQQYADAANRAYALKGAGQQNIAGGLSALGSAGMNLATAATTPK